MKKVLAAFVVLILAACSSAPHSSGDRDSDYVLSSAPIVQMVTEEQAVAGIRQSLQESDFIAVVSRRGEDGKNGNVWRFTKIIKSPAGGPAIGDEVPSRFFILGAGENDALIAVSGYHSKNRMLCSTYILRDGMLQFAAIKPDDIMQWLTSR